MAGETRYGRLTVIRRVDSHPGIHATEWLCRCDCGNEKIIKRTSIMCGTKSCGCLHREMMQKEGERRRKAREYVPGSPYGVPNEFTRWALAPMENASA